jgi:hypothetical protein
MKFDVIIEEGDQIALCMNAIEGGVTLASRPFGTHNQAHPRYTEGLWRHVLLKIDHGKQDLVRLP